MMVLFFVVIVPVSGQNKKNNNLSLNVQNQPLSEVFQQISALTDYKFFYDQDIVDKAPNITLNVRNVTIEDILNRITTRTNLYFQRTNNIISVSSMPPVNNVQSRPSQRKTVSGVITDALGEPIIGATIMEKGTTNGTVTDIDGKYTIQVSDKNAVLVFSFIGYINQEIQIGERTKINISLSEEILELEEVVVVGYGTMRKSDLTGSVVRANIESFRESPNISIVQSLQGSVAGLNVGQVTRSGGEPNIQIRGKNSISGENNPLIIVDNIIFRGNLIDINPNDIESIDILKDASSTAIYGSQASNGVILITTKRTGGFEGKPTFNFSTYFSTQSPVKEFRPGSTEDFLKKIEESDIYNSRTAESKYLERNPIWDPSSKFKTSEEIVAYNDGRSTDWYDLLTNDDMHIQNYNLSLSNHTKYNNYLISLGYTDQKGYMLNEDYSRINARINIDNNITDFLQIGIQSFMTVSDYSGQDASPNHRYLSPFATAEDANGKRILITGGSDVNPLIQAEADHLDKRLNFFGNIYANLDIPFIKGLSYKINFANNYKTTSEYYFRPYENNFQGKGSKSEKIGYDWAMDHILTYKRRFKDIHNVNFTLVYGVEKRTQNSTEATASVFNSMELGYNQLQAGNAELQKALSGAWEEVSLYTMGRLFYGLKDKYLFTGTVRRDGFSGFSENNKFGVFPSLSAAWVLSEEPFLKDQQTWLSQLKLRVSYGSTGNRTIGRYQTLARINAGYDYITASRTSVYTQRISSLASPNLKWETTIGTNIGIDFGVLSHRISGSIEYYNNNTKDLLYEVDIPGISRFQKFPDNLGKIHNNGLEITLSTINIKKRDFEWISNFVFSRNRNKLKQLLGFDNDGDGKEDDLVSEGLFIGKPLNSIYTYKIDGKWQVNDKIPIGYDLGANKVVDLNDDGVIDVNDKKIIGYKDPSYRFSINNSLRYKNWTLRFFINSIQGGKNYYYAADNILDFLIMNQQNHFNFNFPKGIDYWTPENPNARYQRPNINVSSGIAGSGYSQRNFIRLQDISLTYNFPKRMINELNMQNLKVYISGKNLLTITKWPGWDPETGVKISPSGIPVMKSFTIGLDVEF